MAKNDTLSATMQEALALVPADWERIPHRGISLGGRLVKSALFDKTFTALRDRGLIEFKGQPGGWKWRKVDPSRDLAVEAAREAREQIDVLEQERSDLNDRITAARQRLAAIDTEIAQLAATMPASAAA